MSKNKVAIQRWAVLYSHSDSSGKFFHLRIFNDYESALKCFSRDCKYLDTDYDGYNYVALLHNWGVGTGFIPLAWSDNLGCSWDIEDTVNG